jgi:hypothetical protein
MRKRDVLIPLVVAVVFAAVVVVYGKWPRVAGKLVSHKTFREAVAAIDTNAWTYHYGITPERSGKHLASESCPICDEPTASETYQFGPEEFPGSFDPMPDPVDADGNFIPELDERLGRILYSIMMVESGGDSNAVGDVGLRYPAIGAFQIRKPYLDDVHRFAGDVVEGRWGRKLTLADMKDTAKAWWVVRTYLEYYGRVYNRKTGKVPDVGVYARIHNGGPKGWSRSSTNAHCRKVMEFYRDL